MRTTLDVPMPLFTKAKQLAVQKKTTLRAIMIKALDKEIQNQEETSYIPKMITVGNPEEKTVSAAEINALIAEDNDYRSKSWSQ